MTFCSKYTRFFVSYGKHFVPCTLCHKDEAVYFQKSFTRLALGSITVTKVLGLTTDSVSYGFTKLLTNYRLGIKTAWLQGHKFILIYGWAK